MTEPSKQPSEKQIKYAGSLGITIDEGESSYTLSRKIKEVLDKRPKKEDSEQRVLPSNMEGFVKDPSLFTAALDLNKLNIHETMTFEIRIKRVQ